MINRFSDDWFELKLGLFCGGGGGGGGGDSMDDDPDGDFDAMGGSTTSGGAGSDPGDSQDQDEGGYDYPSYSTTRDEIAAAAGVSSDTIVGSGKNGQGVVRSGSGSPVTAGRSVEREAEKQGVTTSEIVDRINAAAAPQPGAGGSGTADDVFGYNDPFESMQFPSYAATPVTAQAAGPALSGAYSPVARAMSPFERTLAAASRPQTADEKLADLARTDRAAALQQFLDVNPNQSPSYAGAYLDALISADDRAALPSSPEFGQRAYSPVDSINIFDQFEQPIGANNLPTGQLSIMQATPITTSVNAPVPGSQEDLARRAAEQFVSRRNTPAEVAAAAGPNAPTDAAVAAARAQLGLTTPQGMTEAEYAAGLGASIGAPEVGAYGSTQQSLADRAMGMSQYGMGMQPTTTEVDAYNQATNQQYEADVLGATSYKESLYNAFNQGLPFSQAVNADVAGRISLDPGVYDTQRMADVYGIDLPQQVAPTGIAGVNQMVDQAMREVELETGVPTSQLSGVMASAAQQAIANTREDYGIGDPSRDFPTGGGLVSEPTPERGPGAVPTRASQAAQSPTYTGVGALDYAPQPASDPLGESIDRAISDFAGYREGQTRTQTPDGVVVDDFMLTRDLVSQAPEYGAAYSPLEQLRMQEGTRTVPAVNVPDIDVFGMTIPTSIPGRIISDLVTPGSAVDRALQAGARPIYDDQGRIEGAIDKNGVVYNVSPYDFESSDAMRAAQAEQAARQVAESQGGDGGEPPILPPVEKAPAEATPEEYQGRDVVKPYQYQPRGPLSYAYTGLPSLAPQKLKPSYRAPKTFSPLFPVS